MKEIISLILLSLIFESLIVNSELNLFEPYECVTNSSNGCKTKGCSLEPFTNYVSSLSFSLFKKKEYQKKLKLYH